jgi:L-arabinose isomerase
MASRFAPLRIGLLGLGLEAYWPQFDGLRQRLESYVLEVERNLEQEGRAIINLGLLDGSSKAVAAGHACREQDIDVLLVYVTTYALSSTLLPVLLRARVPVILLNLQPEAAIAYEQFNQLSDRTKMTGEWLAYCSSCPVPEITNVLRRLDIPFFQITGMLRNDPECWQDLGEWLRAAQAVKSLAHSKLGLMGHYYSGMLDIATDLAQISGRFGVMIEMLETDALTEHRRAVSEQQLELKLEEFRSTFAIEADCSGEELLRAARTSVALDRMALEHELGLLAYYYKGSGIRENEDTMSSIILGTSLLTARGIPVAGEYEVKNVIAMKILDLLGAGGSFTEYYAIDFAEDVVLMGHDGPGHPRIAQDRVRVRPLQVYHGKVGHGLSVEMSVKHGPVTLLSVVEHRERGFQLIFAEGESVPGEILKIGNTNSRYRFPPGARRFVETWNSYGPAHHCAIGVGHIGATLGKAADLLQIPAVQVC